MPTDNGEFNSEEDVKVKYLLPKLKKKGYDKHQCEFEKSIQVHKGGEKKTIHADIVVYPSQNKRVPLIVCETESPQKALKGKKREQAISYARLLDQIPPFTLITNGSDTRVYESINKKRIDQLPDYDDLEGGMSEHEISDSVGDMLKKEAKKDLFVIDDVQKFKNVLRYCHNDIRNNEGMDPTEAFDEMSKLLFCKMYEEKHSENDRFRKSVYEDILEETDVNVVQKIFNETKKDDRYSQLFSDEASIDLSDRTIKSIVGRFEDYDLSLTEFDVKGEAFEYFLGETFTGGLGEYFTPRNVVEFMIEALNPEIEEKIVDPFCGTGGFLIYAFDFIDEKIERQEVSDEQKKDWKDNLSESSLYGTDWKERTSQACKMNMLVHGDGSSGIFMNDGFKNVEDEIEPNTFDICVTNPPFGSSESNDEILRKYELGAGKIRRQEKY